MEKFHLSGQSSMESFLRKMVLSGHVVNLDLKPINEIASILRICSNNLNQIAKRMNSYEYVGKADMKFIRDLHGKLWEMMMELSARLTDL